MKELGKGIAQLAAIIMILITLAVSTAAVSQWFSTDAAIGKPSASGQTQTFDASDAG